MFSRLERAVDLEERVRRYWEREQIFARSVEAAEGRPAWVFFEGPPTANGTPHNGHVLTRVMKDVFPRYKTMRGFRVRRKAGWDTHGLPVEVEVEKQLDVHGKEAIEAYGLERFNRACVDNVFTYVREWDDLTRDIGFWVDLKDPYVTFHKPYVESVWWALGRLFEKGLLYQGHKVVWWWPQGGTTLSAAEVGLGYKSVEDPAATVRFRDVDAPRRSYLAWTTTPWTLPSNVGLAVGADITYAVCDDPSAEGDEVVIAASLAESYGLVVKETLPASALVGRRYAPCFGFGEPEAGDRWVIVEGHHVTDDSGTGIVHIAPAYGEDDLLIARKAGLGMLQFVGPNGKFVEDVPLVPGVWFKDADKILLRDLTERGLLFKRDSYKHDYPFCWRASDDPLMQLARPAWFIRTTAFKDQALANNASVDWHPEHIRDGRFGDFLRNNVDWALSRERFWGTPLNIWSCAACERRVAPTSLDDLRARGAQGIDDTVDEHLRVHRPWIDRVTLPCASCGGTMQRVPEVIDCWFDSGAMPFAQWGFPHRNQEVFRDQFPGDFICEAIDQTRGWFYTLLMISTLIFDEATCAEFGLPPVGFPRPYKTAVVLGHVCDRNGFKESKSKGNYTSPNLVMRGSSWLWAVPDPQLAPGTFGLLKAQVEGLDLGAQAVKLSAERDAAGAAVSGALVVAKVTKKDGIHVHPDDLQALGLDRANGGKIWFHLPIDPPGADAFRWLFCSASAPWANTRLSLRAIQEGQREFLLRLRNVYQFFSIYAGIAAEKGAFRPAASAPRPPEQRAVLDRWILHQLHATLGDVTHHLDAYRLFEASRALLTFTDDLSNWYIRRSRARFWGEGPELEDALWTLYEVLRTLTRMVAPFVPFLAEALHEALERGVGATASPSVHLERWPEVDAALLQHPLAADMALARKVASLGLSARTASKIKVRQPLQAITVVLARPEAARQIAPFVDMIRDELNVREIRFTDDAARFVHFKIKPDFKALGARLGKAMKAVAAAVGAADPLSLKRALDAGSYTVEVDGVGHALSASDVLVQVEAQPGYEAASDPDAVVVLHTELDASLAAEGFVRELQSRVQALRKEEDLGYTDRVELRIATARSEAVAEFVDVLTSEVLAVSCELSAPEATEEGWTARTWDVDGVTVQGWMRRA
jgi:isoleucyl-tRNA synthetase